MTFLAKINFLVNNHHYHIQNTAQTNKTNKYLFRLDERVMFRNFDKKKSASSHQIGKWTKKNYKQRRLEKLSLIKNKSSF